MCSILKPMFATTLNIYTFARPEELGTLYTTTNYNGGLFEPRAAAATGSVWRDWGLSTNFCN